ncbi:primosomal protein N' [Nocardia terpenica]
MLPLLEPAHLDRDFDYLVPAELDAIAQPGVRVRVRFSGRLVDGFVLDRLEKSDHNGKLMRLERVVSAERVLTPEILRLATAVATRYAGTRADVLRLAIPPRHAKTEAEQPGSTKSTTKTAAATAPPVPPEATVDAVTTPPSATDSTVAEVDTRAAESAAAEADTDSIVAGVVSRFPEWGRRYRHGGSFLEALAAGRGPRAAWQAVPGEQWARRLAELAAVTVAGGRSAVIMVPDQRDLDRVLGACVELVGERAVGLSAGLGPAARYRRWLAALRGSARIVVGTRSAIFAPARDLGLIAIWDDGDDTYAEPRAPYPHAREVAMLRAHETGAAFVAGGFARTAEIQAVVDSGWAHDLIADRAVVREYAPRISAPGDSDVALERDPVARAVRIPAVAFTAARKALAAGESVLVQVPRRGYVPALACAKCRTPARCRHCNGPLSLPDNTIGGTEAARRQRSGPAMAATGSDLGAAARDSRGSRAGEWQTRRASAREVGVAWSRSGSGDVAHSPSCRWCGKTEAAFRCGSCGSRALRAVVIGAARTAEELGRAFPGVPIRGSGGAAVLDAVPEGPQVVVATIGAEPVAPGGYAVALLLDGWALLSRADLRAAEDTLRRWMSAAALVRPTGQVIVMAEPSLPTVQALVRWDPVGHAGFELAARTEVRFPPAVRLAAVDGTTDSIAELLGEAKLPADIEILGPVPLPPGARKPFSSGDSPAVVERMILRADRACGAALSRALAAAQAVRSTHRSDAPLRVQIDPVDIG